MEDKLNFELENFQLDNPQSKLADKDNQTSIWEEMDIFKIIEEENLLYATRPNDQSILNPDLK